MSQFGGWARTSAEGLQKAEGEMSKAEWVSWVLAVILCVGIPWAMGYADLAVVGVVCLAGLFKAVQISG